MIGSRITRVLGPAAMTLALAGCGQGRDAAGADSVEAYLTAAAAAAADEHVALLDRLCTQATQPAEPRAERVGPATSAAPVRPSGPPPREAWYAEPVQVFDNLYWVGQTRYTAWAVTTSEGIIIIDPLFDYSVEAEIVEGLAQLGLDPEKIRYVIVSHGHRDHAGGARYLQERFGARVILGTADWDLLERSSGTWPKPVRDIEAEDGYELRLGETTLVLHHTPGHTPGTMSTLIPVEDGDTRHVAALWGGTAFNFRGSADEAEWYGEYIASAERFSRIAEEAGADVLLSNHPQYDGSTAKLRALQERADGDPHPYVIGNERVRAYLTVAADCARAGLAGMEQEIR